MNNMTSQIVEEQIKLLDDKLEDLFNLAGFAILAFIRGDITQDEREALLSEWNDEAQEHYRSFASTLIERVGSELIGEDEEFIEKTTEQLEERMNHSLKEVLNGKIGSRNVYRAEMRTKLQEMR